MTFVFKMRRRNNININHAWEMGSYMYVSSYGGAFHVPNFATYRYKRFDQNQKKKKSEHIG